MTDETKPLDEEELEQAEGEPLPDREEMMLIDASGDALLGPPDLSDPNQ